MWEGKGGEGRERLSLPPTCHRAGGRVGGQTGNAGDPLGLGPLFLRKGPQLGQKPALGRGNKGRYRGSRGGQDWLQS